MTIRRACTNKESIWINETILLFLFSCFSLFLTIILAPNFDCIIRNEIKKYRINEKKGMSILYVSLEYNNDNTIIRVISIKNVILKGDLK